MTDQHTTTRRASRGQIVTAFTTVYVVWGSTYLAIRYAVQTLPPFLMAGVRFVLAGALLYAWGRVRERRATPPARGWAWATLVGVLLLGVGNGGVVWAETRVPSGITALFVATVALWVVVLDWARPGGRRPSSLVLAGVALGLVGVGVLVGPRLAGGRGIDPLGAAVLVVASLSWAAGSLLARSPRMPGPPLFGASLQMLCGGAALLVAGLVAREHVQWSAVSAPSVIAFFYLVTVGAIGGFGAYIWLVGNVAPARAATYAYVNPVVAVLLGWAIAGEAIDARVIGSAALIIGAVALVTLGQNSRVQ